MYVLFMTASSLLPLYRTWDPEGKGSHLGTRCFWPGGYREEFGRKEGGLWETWLPSLPTIQWCRATQAFCSPQRSSRRWACEYMYNNIRPFLLCICVFRSIVNLHVCITSQSFLGWSELWEGYHWFALLLWWFQQLFQVKGKISFFRSPFIISIDSLAACIHIHTQPGISALREVLDRRERLLWCQQQQQPEEETGEEGEEEEKVRLRA